MKERPILFSAPMVRAILDGSKTQTRRVCKNEVYSNGFHFDGHDILCHNDYLPPSAMLMDVKRGKCEYTTSNLEGWDVECPYGQPGDRLWVRESLRFVAVGDNRHEHAVYAADGVRVRRCPDLADWACDGLAFNCARSVPSIHMPRWASRILLEVTGVRVEQLQDISEKDAWAEGCLGFDDDVSGGKSGYSEYAELWESINGAGSWNANPWVWVIEFKRIEQ